MYLFDLFPKPNQVVLVPVPNQRTTVMICEMSVSKLFKKKKKKKSLTGRCKFIFANLTVELCTFNTDARM